MKKIISILTILLILCGCSQVDESKCFAALDSIFDNYAYEQSLHTNNNNTAYYSFYLPSDIQEIEYDDSFHHLIFNSSDFTMNLNVNHILCKKVFNKNPDNPFTLFDNYLVYEYEHKAENDLENYVFHLYKYEDKYYFSLYTSCFSFFGSTNLNEIDELVSHLFELNSSANIDYDKVINAYYLGTMIDYTQEEVDLFNKLIPTQGLLESINENKDAENANDENENKGASDNPSAE